MAEPASMADSACRRKDMLNTLINLSAKMSNKKMEQERSDLPG
jgi:hypothetical protein